MGPTLDVEGGVVPWRVNRRRRGTLGGCGGWHKTSVLRCLPLAAPISLSPLLILTLCGSERVLVVSTEPPDDLSCLTTPGVSGGGGVSECLFFFDFGERRVGPVIPVRAQP